MIDFHFLRVAALAVSLALAGCSGGDAAADEDVVAEGARTVTVARVQMRPMTGTFAASGLLVPREEAAVDSELSGYRVADVMVEEGDYVRQGQVLARLDPALLRSRIAQARAQLQQAQAQAEQQQSEANRVSGLEGTGVLSEEQIATRRYEAETAEAAVRVARASLQELQTQEARLTIRAPVPGVVIERTVRPGDISSPGGEPMFRIARGQLIELAAEVPEAELATIRPGTPARVTLPSGVTLTGDVRYVAPTVDPQTKLGVVRVRLPAHEQLRAGGFARAEFIREARPVPVVPEKAVQFEASGPTVIVITEQNRADRQAIRAGVREDGFVELIEGPPVGTRVALGGGAFLIEGDAVRPVENDDRRPPPANAVAPATPSES